jgi:phosphoribosylformylglycinamidine cyclo-ligase
VAALEGRAGFRALLAQLGQSLALREAGGELREPGRAGRSLLDFGAYASVLDIGGPMALAISTDGVGTKAIVAQLVDRYNTVGIDCVAMNVNDVLCVGAEPISMVDYIAVEGGARVEEEGRRKESGSTLREPQGERMSAQGEEAWPEGDRLLEELGKGLLEGARQAEISIPGGEISQMSEVIKSERPGYGFDLAGTCVGVVDRERIIAGQAVAPGQAIVGLASSGIHSNGLTLARRVLLSSQESGDRRQNSLDARPEELGGQTVGEALLEPTRIYVKSVLPSIRDEVGVTAMAHITSGGFMNLTRVPVAVGFEITWLPRQVGGIFRLIQREGGVSDEEMYRVYNMGVGFCVVCEQSAVSRVIEHAQAAGVEAWEIGRVVDDKRRRVWLREQGLVGEDGVFSRNDRP